MEKRGDMGALIPKGAEKYLSERGKLKFFQALKEFIKEQNDETEMELKKYLMNIEWRLK